MDAIRGFYPEPMKSQGVFQKHILKEYVRLIVLDYLSTTPHVGKLAFIGGTSLRLRKGIEGSLQSVDLNRKRMDFEHLLFDRDNSRRILRFRDFVGTLPA